MTVQTLIINITIDDITTITSDMFHNKWKSDMTDFSSSTHRSKECLTIKCKQKVYYLNKSKRSKIKN